MDSQKRVTVPETTVLPPEVVLSAAQRSGVIGQPLRTDRVQDLAQRLHQWYSRQGYILHKVTGATLQADTATAEVTVQEPTVSHVPVGITFCKEMVVDPYDGTLLTPRQYRDKHETRQSFGFDKMDVNRTLVPTEPGKTKPRRIAQVLGLQPGEPFRWQPDRWARVSSSGLFRQIVRATPETMRDGSVQLHIVATEAPARHLEYGLGKSLYTGSWEGELEFEHGNVLGGGETFGVSVRRGTRDAQPSVKVSFRDEKFGLEKGYQVDVFSDYIGDKSEGSDGEDTDSTKPPVYDRDALLGRRGASFRLRNPISPAVIRNSVVTASVERTSTESGLHENIGSTSLGLGPFVRILPYDARSSVDAQLTLGSRLADVVAPLEDDSLDSAPAGVSRFRPYTAITATTRQMFPLLSRPGARNRPLILALRHSATSSTPNLPRHEAKALGTNNNIRGATPNGRVYSAVRGSTELRLPVDIPLVKTRQDASIVLFGDWLVASADHMSSFYKKTSVGVGLRKSLQGIPLQCDFSYSEGKIKTAFGLGSDFTV